MPNQKYLCIHRSQPGGGKPQPSQSPSPAQMQEMYAAFNAWKEKYAANIVDMGGKLLSNGKVLSGKGVTDGPFVEMKEVVGGFMIVTAESYDAAVAVVRECPGILMGPGSSVEIRELAGP